MPRIFLQRGVHVAETDEQARAEAEPHFYRFFKLFSTSQDPRYAEPSPGGWRHHVGTALRRVGPLDYAELVDSDLTLIGDPAHVRDKLTRLNHELDLDGFVGIFAFGHLSHQQVSRSLRLFAEEVMPAFRATPAAV